VTYPPASPSERERLAPLGWQRLRLLSCLDAGRPWLPGYVDPTQGDDVFAVFRAVVENAVRTTQTATDRLTRSLVGAGRLLTGDLSGALEIVDHLPAEYPVLDAPVSTPESPGHCSTSGPWRRGAVASAPSKPHGAPKLRPSPCPARNAPGAAGVRSRFRAPP
jgi:hypothetical protein